MTKSIYFLFILLINYSYTQTENIVPSIVLHEGLVFKSNEESPYTGKVSSYWENKQLKDEGL